MTDESRLRLLLGGSDSQWLIERLRARAERGHPLTGTVTLDNPSTAQRTAVGRLLGRSLTSEGSLHVRLGELEDVLRGAEICESLIHAVTLLTGAVTNRRGERLAADAAWSHLFDEASSRTADTPTLLVWLTELRSLGLLRRLSGGDITRASDWLNALLIMAARLPARGISLAELAAEVTGDSHALDSGAPLGTLATRMLASVFGHPPSTGADWRRDVWASAGVLCDELSAPVLVLNLRASGESAASRALRVHSDTGEPYRLSVRQLLRDPPQFSETLRGGTVFVCENPTVVAAAANRLGPKCAPLVCVEGQPRTAARLLLTRLAAAGARLLYHGDFDWGGVRIGNVVIGALGAEPWRFSTPDYQRAPRTLVLRGAAVRAAWDAELSARMTEYGRAVHEEHVLAELMEDLGAPATIQE